MLAGFNNLDFALILLLFIGMLIGMIRGVLSQTVSAVSIWLGLVATLWLYKLFSFRILQGLGLPRIGADTLAFFILLIVFFNAFRLLVRYLTKPPEERKKRKMDRDDPLTEAAKSATERFVIGPLNAIGGMIMGFLLTTLWLAIILGALQFILQDALFEAGVPQPGLARQLRQSFMVDSYFNQMLWYLSQSVDLFVPRNADIFKTVLAQILGTTGG